VSDYQRERFVEWLAAARHRLDELEADPPEPCEMCGHIAYPIVATQHCWCDPADQPAPDWDGDVPLTSDDQPQGAS
jgi:hypothetical protein